MRIRWHEHMTSRVVSQMIAVLMSLSMAMPSAFAFSQARTDTLRAISTKGTDAEGRLADDLRGSSEGQPAPGSIPGVFGFMLAQSGSLTKQQIADGVERSPRTIEPDLFELAEVGVLVKEGTGDNATYRLAHALQDAELFTRTLVVKSLQKFYPRPRMTAEERTTVRPKARAEVAQLLPTRVAINGAGRIGVNLIRAWLQNPRKIQVVAINDIAFNFKKFGSRGLEDYVKLLEREFESAPRSQVGGIAIRHGQDADGQYWLSVNEKRINVYDGGDPAALPWQANDVDVVLESTGVFTNREAASKHLQAGAKKVIITAPATGELQTVAPGVNQELLSADQVVLSCASCTTNAIAPPLKLLSDTFGIEQFYMETTHAYTADQSLKDTLRPGAFLRGREAAENIIPTSTGAAKAIGDVIPALKGKGTGIALRVPVPDGSIVGITAVVNKPTTKTEVNELLQKAARGPLSGIMAYTEEELVSRDILGRSESSIIAGNLTDVSADGKLVTVWAWYDNEFGYSNRVMDLVALVRETALPPAVKAAVSETPLPPVPAAVQQTLAAQEPQVARAIQRKQGGAKEVVTGDAEAWKLAETFRDMYGAQGPFPIERGSKTNAHDIVEAIRRGDPVRVQAESPLDFAFRGQYELPVDLDPELAAAMQMRRSQSLLVKATPSGNVLDAMDEDLRPKFLDRLTRERDRERPYTIGLVDRSDELFSFDEKERFLGVNRAVVDAVKSKQLDQPFLDILVGVGFTTLLVRELYLPLVSDRQKGRESKSWFRWGSALVPAAVQDTASLFQQLAYQRGGVDSTTPLHYVDQMTRLLGPQSSYIQQFRPIAEATASGAKTRKLARGSVPGVFAGVFASNLGPLTRAQVAARLGLSERTIEPDLVVLTNLGVLMPSGEGDKRAYRVADDLLTDAAVSQKIQDILERDFPYADIKRESNPERAKADIAQLLTVQRVVKNIQARSDVRAALRQYAAGGWGGSEASNKEALAERLIELGIPAGDVDLYRQRSMEAVAEEERQRLEQRREKAEGPVQGLLARFMRLRSPDELESLLAETRALIANPPADVQRATLDQLKQVVQHAERVTAINIPVDNAALKVWAQGVAAWTGVSDIQVVDASDDERLLREAIAAGELIDLGNGTYYARSHPGDTARTEGRTFVATDDPNDTGRFNNWTPANREIDGKPPIRPKVQALMRDASQGKTMYVIPYLMATPGSPLSKWAVGVELTDNRYVALSMIRMARVGRMALAELGQRDEFVRGVHVTGDLDRLRRAANPTAESPDDDRYFVTFARDREIWHFGSAYGGNALLAKIAHGLRLASFDAHLSHLPGAQGPVWLVDQMGLLGITNPETGEVKYGIVGKPSGSGKTNLSMLDKFLGDDIVWLRIGADGRLYGMNPEYGVFGIAPQTDEKSNPSAMAAIGPGSGTIFTNVAYNEITKQVWWEGMSAKPTNLTGWYNWKGEPITAANKDEAWAQGNSRFTVPIARVPNVSPDFENPQGVPISFVIWGGRVTSPREPLIRLMQDPATGVADGAVMGVETTSAIDAPVVFRSDPMAMMGFYSYPEVDFFQDWLDMMNRAGDHAPIFVHVNWFAKGKITTADGEEKEDFLWAGYGENLRPLRWALWHAPKTSNEIAQAQEAGLVQVTPVGLIPTRAGLREAGLLEGLNIPDEQLDRVLTYDPTKWEPEFERRTEYLSPFGERLPGPIRQAHETARADNRRRMMAGGAQHPTDIASIEVEPIEATPEGTTLRARIRLEDGTVGRWFGLPAGTSTGEFEATTVGQKEAVANIELIHAMVQARGMADGDLLQIHQLILEQNENIAQRLSRSPTRYGGLGANAVLPFEAAFAYAKAAAEGVELRDYLRATFPDAAGEGDTLPLMVIWSGGQHAPGTKYGEDKFSIQELLIAPARDKTVEQAKEMYRTVRQTLDEALREAHFEPQESKEGGIAQQGIGSIAMAIQFVIKAAEEHGYVAGRDFHVRLDSAANSFYNRELRRYDFDGELLTTTQLVAAYDELDKQFPGVIESIEDPFAEFDHDGWRAIKAALPHWTRVADDLTATQLDLVEQYADLYDELLVKPNQAGSLVDTMRVIAWARQHGKPVIVSHRSKEAGKTSEEADVLIAQIASAAGAPWLKTAPTQPVRTAKIDELTRLAQRKVRPQTRPVTLLAQRITATQGARTGEVSIDAAIAAGATGIIAGHSETRPGSPTPIRDSNEEINRQIRAAAARQEIHTIILAIGETEKDIELASTMEHVEARKEAQVALRDPILERQLRNALKGLSAYQLEDRLVIAYEPRWAIAGSGGAQVRPATAAYAQSAHRTIREFLRSRYGDAFADKIRIIYGGSATADNAAEYLNQPDVDGLLPGGASTATAKFVPLLQAAQVVAAEKLRTTGRRVFIAGNQKTYEVKEVPEAFAKALSTIDTGVIDLAIAPTLTDIAKWRTVLASGPETPGSVARVAEAEQGSGSLDVAEELGGESLSVADPARRP